MLTLHVGIDDTDSPRMGCTTYVASLLVEKLGKLNVSFIDYPNLVRLNPDVPWKTRGNGALCLRFKCDKKSVTEAKDLVIDTVEKNSDMNCAGTEPGIVFFQGNEIPKALSVFAKQAIQSLVRMQDTVRLINAYKAEAVGFNSGRGIIGALAAIGETLNADHTYEFIAYRTLGNRGTPRKIDVRSVEKMDRKTAPLTFNNIDLKTKRILIAPHGPDPILYGIRGESPAIVKRAQRIVRAKEPIERWTIFRTNQGTDAHLRKVDSIDKVLPHHPVIVRGMVTEEPIIIPRRHVIFSIADKTGHVKCAAYEPTEDLQKAANELCSGDVVEAFGGVRSKTRQHDITINLEKLKVLKVTPKIVFHNPLCPTCGKHMKSMGAGQGFRCKKCGFRSETMKKKAVEEKRTLKPALYVTSPRSQRHLTKPLSRYGLEKSGKPKSMTADWFWVNDSGLE